MAKLDPISVLNSARQAVPAVNLALGLAGVAAAAAVIVTFLGSGEAAVRIMALTFVGMILLYILSLAYQNPNIGNGPVILMIWAVTLFFVAFLAMTVTAFAIERPCGWVRFLSLQASSCRAPDAQMRFTVKPKHQVLEPGQTEDGILLLAENVGAEAGVVHNQVVCLFSDLDAAPTAEPEIATFQAKGSTQIAGVSSEEIVYDYRDSSPVVWESEAQALDQWRAGSTMPEPGSCRVLWNTLGQERTHRGFASPQPFLESFHLPSS